MTSKNAFDIMKDRIRDKYEGDPEWKAESDRLFGPEEASALWHELEKSHIIPEPEADVNIVSVSANIPTHELAMFKADLLTRKGKSRFVIGDISELRVKTFIDELVEPYTTFRNRFAYIRWDAYNLPVPDSSADVIFDRKGALWHIAHNYRDTQKLIETFKEYHRILKPGGSLVVDNIGGFEAYLKGLSRERQLEIALKTLSGIRFSDIYPDAPMQYEPSTIDKIRTLALAVSDNTELIITIEDLFEIQDIGEGALSVKIFTKK